MKVFEWLTVTDPSAKGLNRAQKKVLVDLRTRVCESAGTKIAYLNNAKCRGSIGKNLTMRLEEATKGEKFKIRLIDELREIK